VEGLLVNALETMQPDFGKAPECLDAVDVRPPPNASREWPNNWTCRWRICSGNSVQGKPFRSSSKNTALSGREGSDKGAEGVALAACRYPWAPSAFLGVVLWDSVAAFFFYCRHHDSLGGVYPVLRIVLLETQHALWSASGEAFLWSRNCRTAWPDARRAP